VAGNRWKRRETSSVILCGVGGMAAPGVPRLSLALFERQETVGRRRRSIRRRTRYRVNDLGVKGVSRAVNDACGRGVAAAASSGVHERRIRCWQSEMNTLPPYYGDLGGGKMKVGLLVGWTCRQQEALPVPSHTYAELGRLGKDYCPSPGHASFMGPFFVGGQGFYLFPFADRLPSLLTPSPACLPVYLDRPFDADYTMTAAEERRSA